MATNKNKKGDETLKAGQTCSSHLFWCRSKASLEQSLFQELQHKQIKHPSSFCFSVQVGRYTVCASCWICAVLGHVGFSFVCDLACVSDVCFSDMAITASAVFLALSLGVCVCVCKCQIVIKLCIFHQYSTGSSNKASSYGWALAKSVYLIPNRQKQEI